MQDAPFYDDLLGDEGGDIASYFDPTWFHALTQLEEGQYWYLHRRDVILDALRAVRGGAPGGRFIDLGCGGGGVATHLNEHGFEVDYADVHREALEAAYARARDRLGEGAAARRFVRLDAIHQPLPGRYDGVLMLDALEHLPDDRGAARRVRDALDPGGIFLFTVPAYRFLWSPWDDLAQHKRRYTPAQARALAEDTGFAVARLTHVFFPLFFAASAVKGLRAAQALVAPPRAPTTDPTELVEGRSSPGMNAAMLRLLDLERRWLTARDLPLGTSLLCVAKAR